MLSSIRKSHHAVVVIDGIVVNIMFRNAVRGSLNTT